MAKRYSNTCLGTLHFLLGRRRLTRYCLIPPPHPVGNDIGRAWLDSAQQALLHVVLHELGSLHHHDFRGERTATLLRNTLNHSKRRPRTTAAFCGLPCKPLRLRRSLFHTAPPLPYPLSRDSFFAIDAPGKPPCLYLDASERMHQTRRVFLSFGVLCRSAKSGLALR